MHLSGMLPYCLPASLTAFLIMLAYADGTWVFVAVLFTAAAINRYWGAFSMAELSREYRYFHEDATMSVFKAVNGVFFLLFNIWAPVFCTVHAFAPFSFLTLLFGVVTVNSGFSLSLAHDLIHAKQPFQRWLGEILMLQNGFFYLAYDHVFIHHRHVGTRSDPASASLNENLYTYLYGSLSGRMRMLFFEQNETHTKQQRRLYRNLRWKLLICLAWLSTAFFASTLAFVLVTTQCVLVILLYETTTYIQHYGLRRREGTQVQLDHAWNSFDRLYNYLYFFMPVHSLHHTHRAPETADAYAGPVMPRHFPAMLFLAFRPRRWFKIMNPLVRQVEERQDLAKTQAMIGLECLKKRMHRIYRNLLIGFLGFHSLQAQRPWDLEVAGTQGDFYTHKILRARQLNPIRSLDVSLCLPTDGKRYWQQIHHYPDMGLRLRVREMGRPAVYGYVFSLIPYLEFYPWKMVKPASLLRMEPASVISLK